MSEEINVVTSATADGQTTETKKQLTTNDLQCGYLVGLAHPKDNEPASFTFQLLGEDRGLLELQGLHGYASNHIQKLTDEALNVGNGFTVNVLGQVTQALLEKLEEVTKEVTDLKKTVLLLNKKSSEVE